MSILTTVVTSQTPPKREFRAAWIATVANLDWPSTPNLTPDAQRGELAAMLDQLQACGINVAIFQVRPECDALYQSSIEPWSYWLSGSQGVPPNPLYDPLQFAIDETHKRGMELHAWFNPYRAVRMTSASGSYTPASTHVSVLHPDWILTFPSSKLKILDPGLPMVRNYVARVVADIVRRYDVDGIHADDYFYPYDPIISNEDNATFARYSRGFTNQGDWRRDNVKLLMKQISDSVQAIRPSVKFGMSPFGIWKNGVPPGITGLDAYNEIYGDAIAWLHQHIIDYLTPQLYWKIGGPQDCAKLVSWWADSTYAYGRHLYPGHIFGSYTASELPNQVRLDRANPKVGGSVFFRATMFGTNTLGFADSVKYHFYKYPSLLPVMAWKDTIAPYPPRAIRYAPLASGGRPTIQWDLPIVGLGDTAYRYVVYRFDHRPVLSSELADPRNILFVIGSRQFGLPAPPSPGGPYYYLVTALDRNYNESDTSNVLCVAPPLPPVLASPASGTTALPESVTVVWRSSALAASYRLQVSSDPSFVTGIVVDDSTIVDTVKVLRTLFGQTAYYWRLKASNVGGSGAFSGAFSFATGFPLAETLVYPPNLTVDVPVSQVFRWNRSTAATSYRFQLSKFTDFSSVAVDSGGLADTTFSASGLLSYTIHNWRVKATNTVGTSDWSSPFRFRTIGVTAVAQEKGLPTAYALSQNYPNPFNPVTTIQFSLPTAGRVEVKIYDILGREETTLVNEEMPAGTFSVTWNATNDPSGVYFYRMWAGSYVATKRMLVLK